VFSDRSCQYSIGRNSLALYSSQGSGRLLQASPGLKATWLPSGIGVLKEIHKPCWWCTCFETRPCSHLAGLATESEGRSFSRGAPCTHLAENGAEAVMHTGVSWGEIAWTTENLEVKRHDAVRQVSEKGQFSNEILW